jgi:hypothetical protein
MNPETTTAWQTRGREVLGQVLAAERELSGTLRLNDISMLAAADRLSAVTRVANAWLAANPCPDSARGVQMARMLNNCAEVALTVQRIATNLQSNTAAVASRIENLAAVIRVDARALEAW